MAKHWTQLTLLGMPLFIAAAAVFVVVHDNSGTKNLPPAIVFEGSDTVVQKSHLHASTIRIQSKLLKGTTLIFGNVKIPMAPRHDLSRQFKA